MRHSIVTKFALSIMSAAFCVSIGAANADKLGDPNNGQAYAQTHCASCHSIVPDGNTSPVAEATPFQAVANTGGMTRTALYVFFRSPHPTMPNLIVKGDDLDNVIAYILILKTAKQ